MICYSIIFGRHFTTKGEQMLAKTIDGDAVQVEVVGIRLVETERLTDDDFKAIGYDSRADYMTDWGDVFGQRVWMVHVRYIA